MSIRITQPMMFNNFVSQMQSSLSAYMQSNEQGATQKKINAPSDDPAGTYRVLTSRDAINATKQLQKNVDTAKGWLQLEDNVLSSQVSTVIARLKQLAEQASTGTLSAENREQIGYEVREQFGTLLNLSNTEFEGKSVFAGHRYDHNAFEQGLALTSWDDTWASEIADGNYSVTGDPSKSVLFQFTQDGTLAAGTTYRWTTDAGQTWHDGAVTTSTDPISGATLYNLDFDGVSVTMKNAVQVTAADTTDTGTNISARNGTTVYVRPTAVYQGDDKDPPAEITLMGAQGSMTAQASGTFGKNVLVRLDDGVDMSTTGQEFAWSYSTDGGTSWVAAKGTTMGTGDLRLPVPGGYLDMTGTSAVPAGAQVLIHPSRADLDYEILKDTYIPVNGVGKDIFGGYYEGRPAIEGNENLFEVVGAFIGYLENNNQEGCQKTLEALASAQEHILTQATRIGGLENRISVASDVLSYQKLDQQERLSYTEDIDLTELMTKLAQQQLTYQTVLQSSSMIMRMSLVNYV